jgi:Tol biopolymer transport system component
MIYLLRVCGVVGVFSLAIIAGALAVGSRLDVGDEMAYVSRIRGDAEIMRMDIGRMLSVNLTNSVYWWPGVPGAQDQAPAWSPDGQWIAFQSTRGGNEDIWIMDANGRQLHQLTTNRGMDMHPEWSPDGCCLVYQSWQGDDYEIVMMDVAQVMAGDISSKIQLTNNTIGDRHPAFSVDGTRVIFASAYENDFGAFELFTIDLDGNNLRELPAVADDFNALHPVYSPDGEFILFDGFGEGSVSNIFIRRSSGPSSTRRIIGQPSERDNYDAYFPTWSPDGSHILYVTTRESENSDIFIAPIEDFDTLTLGPSRQLTVHPSLDIHPIMRPKP